MCPFWTIQRKSIFRFEGGLLYIGVLGRTLIYGDINLGKHFMGRDILLIIGIEFQSGAIFQFQLYIQHPQRIYSVVKMHATLVRSLVDKLGVFLPFVGFDPEETSRLKL